MFVVLRVVFDLCCLLVVLCVALLLCWCTYAYCVVLIVGVCFVLSLLLLCPLLIVYAFVLVVHYVV